MLERSGIVKNFPKTLAKSLGRATIQTVPTKKPFEIDITDLDAIRAKIPEAEAMLEAKREEVREAQRDFAYWQSVVDRLRLLGGQPRSDAKSKNVERAETATDAVIRTLNESAVPLRAAEVNARLDEPLKRETVSWALWNAERAGRIQKIGTGVYASLEYREPTTMRLVES